MIIWKQVRATGRVQGVFYRDSTQQKAQSIGLTGWVRNTPDGAVVALLEGTKEQIEEMVRWMRTGPQLARVEDVKTLAQGEGSFNTSFEIIY